MLGMFWPWGWLLTASFGFQMVNLSFFSVSLSEFYILLQSETRERERAGREDERGMGGVGEEWAERRGDQENPSPSFIPSPLLTRVLSARRELRGDQRWAQEEFWQSQSRHRTAGKFCISIIKLKAKNDIKEWWDKRRSLFISSNCNHCPWSI